MKIILHTWFQGNSWGEERQRFIEAQRHNANDPNIEKIIIFTSTDVGELNSHKIEVIRYDDRIRYPTLLSHIRSNWQPDTLYGIIKPTAYIHKGSNFLKQIYWENKCLVLSRKQKGYKPFRFWSANNDYTIRWDSFNNHDAWFFRDMPPMQLVSQASERVDLYGASAKFAHSLTQNFSGAVNYSHDIEVYDDYFDGIERDLDKPISKEYPQPYGYILVTPITEWENIREE